MTIARLAALRPASRYLQTLIRPCGTTGACCAASIRQCRRAGASRSTTPNPRRICPMLSARNTVANQSTLALRPQLRTPEPVAPDTRGPMPPSLSGEIIGACETVADLMRLAVLDAEGKLVAVLGLASIDPELLQHSHAFTGTVMDGMACAEID